MRRPIEAEPPSDGLTRFGDENPPRDGGIGAGTASAQRYELSGTSLRARARARALLQHLGNTLNATAQEPEENHINQLRESATASTPIAEPSHVEINERMSKGGDAAAPPEGLQHLTNRQVQQLMDT